LILSQSQDDLNNCGKVNVSFDYLTGVVNCAGVNYSLVSFTELPAKTFAGILGRFRELWLTKTGVICVLNVKILDQREVKKQLNTRRKFCFWQSNSNSAKIEATSIGSEIEQLLGEMFRDGEKVISVRAQLIVNDEDIIKVKKASGHIVTNLYRMGIESIQESALSLTLFLQCIPFGFRDDNDVMLKRSKKITTINLAHMLPVYGSFRGNCRGIQLLNRDGEIVKFSFFDSEVAPHGIIAGVSGSGKSVWSNNLIVSVLGEGAKVFVIDRGNSYKKLAQLLGGTYVEFSPNKPVSFNPFGNTLDNEKHIFLTHLVAEMCTQGDYSIGPKEINLISKAISLTYEKKVGEEVLVSDLKRTMEEMGAQNLAICLELFVGKGPYAEFFDKPCEFDVSNSNLVVFELGELGLLKEVASVVLLSIVHIITKECMGNLSVEKYLLIDEAWTLLRSNNTCRFLENVYRTYRKYRAAAIMITQQISDFSGQIAEAIRSNAPNRIFLKQTQETIAMMSRELDLSEEEKKMLETLKTCKGVFSEALVLSDKTRGVCRLILDKFSYWLMTSDPSDNEKLYKLINRFTDNGVQNPVLQALKEISK
ncbi:MAG: ATP-binding protein, partial [Planctomycetes bacterium]|nr:ATP-binding protein [Planctomycetota bacterium]